MNKRYQVIDGQISVAILVVLSQSELSKLESPDYYPQIDNLAKDLNLEWAVETNGNIAIAALSRLCGSIVEKEVSHDIEMKAIAFMNTVDKMTLPTIVVEKEQDAKTLEFVKKLLNDIMLPSDDNCHVRGALIMDTTTHPMLAEPICWGHLSHDTLKEMCELYIKAHDHE